MGAVLLACSVCLAGCAETSSVSERDAGVALPEADAGAPLDSCSPCHADHVARHASGRHGQVVGAGCATCHAGAREHAQNPAEVRAEVDFSIEKCGTCHLAHQESYLADDAARAGRWGGSITDSKYAEFPEYRYLMGGHGFTLEYNEDRAHRFMLKDHREIKRKQNAACLQCKSTPVAYYWGEKRRGEVLFDKQIPWSDAVARIDRDWPKTAHYGAGCTHCHDPHAAGFRVVRKALVGAVLERGTDPYTDALNVVPSSAEDLTVKMNERGVDGRLTRQARRLAGTLTCAQCHVEYTCGPGTDKEIRDDFPWRKLADLETYYEAKFGMAQDWKHSVTGLPGVKAQHPETEFFWNSAHHQAGVACSDCHMARFNGSVGHWMTSPLKRPEGTCGQCHGGSAAKVAAVLAEQDAVMALAREVETLLSATMRSYESRKAAGAAPEVLEGASRPLMSGLLFWEFTVVSENSAGWHNPSEARQNLAKARELALEAKGLLGD